MKRLTKGQIAERDKLVTRLNEVTEKVSAKHSEFQAAIEEYNNVVADIEPFRDDITSDMQSYMDDRSENWTEGEKGQAYSEWKDEWDNFDVSPIEIPDLPDMEHAAALEQLPEEAPEP